MIETKKENKINYCKITIHGITILVTIILLVFIIHGLKTGIFASDKTLYTYIKSFGMIAPITFLIIQVIQVIFPVIPGGASCFVGVLAFGPIWGFIYNYVGLCIGSTCAFFISKKYGQNIVKKLFSEQTIDKYLGYAKNKTFEKIFFFGILLPGAPDDLLCYVSGLTKMSFKKFLIIILLCKPLTLIFYSLGIDAIKMLIP